ncbi:MAG: c-type cytochrome, partial [Vicinamibacterales bacterium]
MSEPTAPAGFRFGYDRLPTGPMQLMTTWPLIALLALALPAASSAQVPVSTPNIVSVVETMRVYTAALGVDCAHCHDPGDNGRLDYRSNNNPRKQVARNMIAMMADINAMSGLGRSEDSTTRVTCLTCHRGVPNPRPLDEIIRRTVELEGGES